MRSAPLSGSARRGRDNDGVALDVRVGPIPFAVVARDGELFQLLAFHDEAAIGVCEVQSD